MSHLWFTSRPCAMCGLNHCRIYWTVGGVDLVRCQDHVPSPLELADATPPLRPAPVPIHSPAPPAKFYGRRRLPIVVPAGNLGRYSKEPEFYLSHDGLDEGGAALPGGYDE